MKRVKQFVVAALCLSLTVACEKSEENSLESPSDKKTATDYPYEIYDPLTEDPYEELRLGLIDAFDANNAAENIDPTQAVWLIEGGLNALFNDSAYNEYDSIVSSSIGIALFISNETTTKGNVKDKLTEAYNHISGVLGANSNYTFEVADVRFVSDNGTALEFAIDVNYLQNASNVVYSPSPWAWGPVPAAPYSAWGGSMSACPGFTYGTRGAWQNVERQVKAVTPKLHFPVIYNSIPGRTVSNVISLASTKGLLAHRYLDGTYLYGGSNALNPLHTNSQPSQGPHSCVSISDQGMYAQALANQLQQEVGKRYYWDGISSLNVQTNGTFDFNWVFSANLSHQIFAKENSPQISAAQLGF